MKKIILLIDNGEIKGNLGEEVKAYDSVDEISELFDSKISPSYLVFLEGVHDEDIVFVHSVCSNEFFPHFIWITKKEYKLA